MGSAPWESVGDAVLRASWQGACLAIVVAAVCVAMRRVPAKWRSALWLLVLVRLVLPIVPESPVSLFNLSAALPIATLRTDARDEPLDPATATAQDASQNMAFPAEPPERALKLSSTTATPTTEAPAVDRLPPWFSLWNLLAAVWLAGLAGMVVYRVVLVARLRTLLRECRPIHSGRALSILNACRRELGVTRSIALLVTDRLSTPAVAGLLRPKIIVPTRILELDSAELSWLFRHELAHVRRGDVAIQSLWWWARAVHWFNPLVWWAASRAQLETELACDEAVLERTRGTQHIGYGQALLRVAELMVQSAPVPASAGFLLRKRALARRVESIVSYRRRPRRWALAAVCVLLLLAGTGLTDAVRPSPAAAEVGQQPKNDKNEPAAPTVKIAAKSVAQADAKPPAEPGAQKPKRTMRILVLGPDEKPVAKTAIHVSVWTKEPFRHNTYYNCDADGRVTVELPQSIDILRIWARSGNLVPLFAHWWPEQIPARAEIPTEFTFHLVKGTTIGGVVQDENGKPIENVGVQVALAKGIGIDEPENPVPDTWLASGTAARRTDANGRWKLENVPAGADVNLMLTHRDYSSDYAWGALQKQQGVTMDALRDETATIAMHRGIPLTGTVTDADGKPLADALVIWGDDPYLQQGKQETRTDRQGIYRFPPLPTGPMTLTVVAEGWAPELRKIDITPANPPQNFQLSAGLKLRLAFVDADGKAIPDVYVGIRGWRGGKSLYNHKHPNVLDSKIPRQADKDGIFEWTWAPRDKVSYWFGKEGFPEPSEGEFYADDQEHVVTLP